MSDYAKQIIEPGDRISQLAAQMSQRSYHYGQTIDMVTNLQHFRGPVGWRWKKPILQQMLEGKMYQLPQNDGAGNKPNIFTLNADPVAFSWLGWELAAMCPDDVVRWGGYPSHFESNQIDFQKVTDANFHLAAATVNGYGDMLRKMDMPNITGETAIMKYSITAFCDMGGPNQLILTWAGTCTGLMHVDKLIDGSRIEPGQPIVGLLELNSYRCNGGSFHIKNLQRILGSEKVRSMVGEDKLKKYIKLLCLPSTSFAKPVAKLHGWLLDGSIIPAKADITGICHWTGGGIRKMVDILPPGVGVNLNKMPKVPMVQMMGQRFARGTENELDDLHALETLHPGVGMYLVCRTKRDAHAAISFLKSDGVKAKIVGETTASDKNEVLVSSRFMNGGVVSSLDLD